MLQADATEHIKAVIDRIKPEYLVRFCPLKLLPNCFVPFVVHTDIVRVSGAFVQSKYPGLCIFVSHAVLSVHAVVSRFTALAVQN